MKIYQLSQDGSIQNKTTSGPMGMKIEVCTVDNWAGLHSEKADTDLEEFQENIRERFALDDDTDKNNNY